MSSPARVDICIVNYFSADDVRRCVETLGSWDRGRVWLVENSVDEREYEALRQIAASRPCTELLVPGENLGFGRGCNLAFERSDAEYFLLLNPDALIGARDLHVLLDAMQRDARIAAASPAMYWNLERSFLLPSAFPQTPAVALALNLAPRSRGLTRWAASRYLARQHELAEGTFDVGFLTGAVMLLRRSAVQAAGGLFDPEYFMFYEDSDLSLRLRAAGHRLAVVGAARAVHEYRHKASKGPLMAQAREVYFRKRFAAFHRATRGLRRIDALARAVPLDRWFEVLPQPCADLESFRSQTRDATVLAFSPSPLMMPAIFRPDGFAPTTFSPADWALLEPAGYAALLHRPGGPPYWCYFERVSAPPEPSPP